MTQSAPANTPRSDRTVWLDCQGERLLAILSPGAAGARTGVLMIVGGRQYRVGSGRFFVTAARSLAAAGVPTLRFDTRGMGDSSGDMRTFEDIQPDIGAAIDALCAAEPGLDGVVLWGLCDAASAALMYWGETRDPRVRGLVLLNPWVRSQETLARTRMRHHYRLRAADPAFWKRLLRGGVHWHSVRSWWQDWRAARASRHSAEAFQGTMARAFRAFDAPLAVILSEHDETALEFTEVAASLPEWTGTLQQRNVHTARVGGADHTFSLPLHREQVTDITLQLLRRIDAGAAPHPGVAGDAP